MLEKYIDDKSKLGLKTEVNNLLNPFYQRAMKSKDPELKILAFGVLWHTQTGQSFAQTQPMLCLLKKFLTILSSKE